MSNDDDVTDDVTAEYQSRLRSAVEQSAAREADWTAFHIALAGAVAPHLAELRRRASGGYRATAAAGAAWWDYAARASLAAVPLGLAAALLLFTYLRSDDSVDNDARPVAATAAVALGGADSALDAFESVLTGAAAPRAMMHALIPVPAAAFVPDSAGGSVR